MALLVGRGNLSARALRRSLGLFLQKGGIEQGGEMLAERMELGLRRLRPGRRAVFLGLGMAPIWGDFRDWGKGGGADALDFPFERNSARLIDPAPDLLAKRFEIGSGRRAKIDEEVAMHGRHLGAAEDASPGTLPCRSIPTPSCPAGS